MKRCFLLLITFAITPSFASAQVTQELLGETGVPLHDFVVSGNQLLAVTGGGCGAETVEGGGCPNGKSSIHSVNTTDWTTTATASVPGSNGLPGAVLMNGSLYSLTGESDLGPDPSEQVLLKLNPDTGAIEQNYGLIYYADDAAAYSNWCTDLALVDGRLVMGCWGLVYEVTFDESDTAIATKLYDFYQNAPYGYLQGLVSDDNGTLWASFCDDDTSQSNMVSISDIFGGSPSPVMGPAIPDNKMFMALGHQGGSLIGSWWKYSCGGGDDASWVGTVSRLLWEGDAYPAFTDYSALPQPSMPVPALPPLALWLLVGLAGFFGIRRLR